MFRCAVVAALCAAVLVPGALAQDRVSASEKGSLLVYPKVEVRWDQAGNLIQDTFITICNDFNADVDVQLYFVSETCTNIDNVITLTSNEPAYWSVASGLPKGVSPWTALGEPYDDPEGTGEMIMRGYIIAFAINADYAQIKWNHLYGGANIVHYAFGSAWEYTAYAFQVVDPNVAHGDVAGTPGTLELNGAVYDSGFQVLLLEFFASGSQAFSGGGRAITHDTDLTLLILNNDLTAASPGPHETIAKFDIWNEDEVGFSGATLPFIKWTEVLLSNIHPHFLIENLQADMGRARITGVDPSNTPNESLLAVAAKVLDFDQVETAYSGKPLVGAGVMDATIMYDPLAPPPTILQKLAPLNVQSLRFR
jgi:hypothetical protein